jgi:glycosyltransferase involved in cell wall biosynthesis
MGEVMRRCDWKRIPDFKSLFPVATRLQRLLFSRRIWSMFEDLDVDIVFSTQSSPFLVNKRMYHFIYNSADVFGYPLYATPLIPSYSGGGFARKYFGFTRLMGRILWNKSTPNDDWFFALGTGVLSDLKKFGYPNSSLAFPPCRVEFEPRFPKKNRVVQSARIIPDKRLELYSTIAARLPEFDFVLIGRRDLSTEKLHPGYADHFLSTLPKNVAYIEATVRDRPDLLEESSIFLYTGNERGMVLGLVEAMAAGCLPFAPNGTGAADLLKAARIGVTYDKLDEVVQKLRSSLASEANPKEVEEISGSATRFSPDRFKSWVDTVLLLDGGSAVPDYWPA